MKVNIVYPYTNLLGQGVVQWMLSLILFFCNGLIFADESVLCNVGSGYKSTECGVDSVANDGFDTALGHGATATGSSSIALGKGAVASSLSSIALGTEAMSTGTDTVGIGVEADVSGHESTAIGAYSSATGYRSTTIGEGSNAPSSHSTALGAGAFSFGQRSTSLGAGSSSRATNSTAVGESAYSEGRYSTSLGAESDARGYGSTAVGANAYAEAHYSTAVGGTAWARSDYSTRLGYAAGYNNHSPVTSSPASIAIGNYSNIRPDSQGAIAIGGDSLDGDKLGADVFGKSAIAIGFEAMTSADGAIAIGGDLDGDGVGAFAGNVNAIAIGADVTASAPNTITMGYPVYIRDNNTTVSTRNLLRLSNVGPVGFRFEDSAAGHTWMFRQTTDGGITIDALNTVGTQEVKISQGGNMKIKGTLTQGSSRENKKQIKSLHYENILEQLDTLPIHQWTYKHEQDNIKHIGPMAEDFYQAFQLGSSSKGISSLDSSGVALAAIKALSIEKNKQIDELKKENLKLHNSISVINAENSTLREDVNQMKAQLAQLYTLKQQLAQLFELNSNSVNILAHTK